MSQLLKTAGLVLMRTAQIQSTGYRTLLNRLRHQVRYGFAYAVRTTAGRRNNGVGSPLRRRAATDSEKSAMSKSRRSLPLGTQGLGLLGVRAAIIFSPQEKRLHRRPSHARTRRDGPVDGELRCSSRRPIQYPLRHGREPANTEQAGEQLHRRRRPVEPHGVAEVRPINDDTILKGVSKHLQRIIESGKA
jgi:hypothetical protein